MNPLASTQSALELQTRLSFQTATPGQRKKMLTKDAFRDSSRAQKVTLKMVDGSTVSGFVECDEPAARVVWSIESGVQHVPLELLAEPPAGVVPVLTPSASDAAAAGELLGMLRTLATMPESALKSELAAFFNNVTTLIENAEKAYLPTIEENDRLKAQVLGLNDEIARLQVNPN